PPNPPATSLEETIKQRTLLYLLLVVLSAALFVGSVLLARRLMPKLGVWNATLIGAADYVVSMAVVFLILPGIHETPSTFPADDLYQFRLYSLGTQVVIWATIGLVFGALASRVLEGKRQEQLIA
ncbi:CbtA family protein, partial [Mycolicibacterium septicum]